MKTNNSKKKYCKMNKVVIGVVMCVLLVIVYRNSKVLVNDSLLILFQGESLDSGSGRHIDHNQSSNTVERQAFAAIRATQMAALNRTDIRILHKKSRARNLSIQDYNIFVIYTKGNYEMQQKFELFARSLLKYSSVYLNLHVITDPQSQATAEEILHREMHFYRKNMKYRIYNIHECVGQIKDIVQAMISYFSSNPGSYYSDVLFYLSLGLHRIADSEMRYAALIDCDVVFRSDVRLLFKNFKYFSKDNLFGIAPELTPVYRHVLYRYRSMHPNTTFGSAYSFSVPKMREKNI